jgi:hypothetical protein
MVRCSGRHPFPPQELDAGHQLGNRAPHGLSAEKKRFVQSTRAQQPVGKDMPALRISTQLDLVHRKEVAAHALWHRFDSTDPVLGSRRNNPLFAGDQRHDRGSANTYDPVIDFTCQQPQRQSDDSGAMAEHPLDGICGLARVGRPENRRDQSIT